jgi:hypothetical protein
MATMAAGVICILNDLLKRLTLVGEQILSIDRRSEVVGWKKGKLFEGV